MTVRGMEWLGKEEKCHETCFLGLMICEETRVVLSPRFEIRQHGNYLHLLAEGSRRGFQVPCECGQVWPRLWLVGVWLVAMWLRHRPRPSARSKRW